MAQTSIVPLWFGESGRRNQTYCCMFWQLILGFEVYLRLAAIGCYNMVVVDETR